MMACVFHTDIYIYIYLIIINVHLCTFRCMNRFPVFKLACS